MLLFRARDLIEFSLGATFYELLTGKPPFDTSDPMGLVYQHLAKMPKAPHEVVKTVPVPVSEIVMKLLAKSPESRYQSCAGLKHDLEQCLENLKNSGSLPSE